MIIALCSSFCWVASSAHSQFIILMYYYEWQRMIILFVVFVFLIYFIWLWRSTPMKRERQERRLTSDHHMNLFFLRCVLFFLSLFAFQFICFYSLHHHILFSHLFQRCLFIMVDFNCMFRKKKLQPYKYISSQEMGWVSSEQRAASSEHFIRYKRIYSLFSSLWLRLLIKIMAHHHPNTMISWIANEDTQRTTNDSQLSKLIGISITVSNCNTRFNDVRAKNKTVNIFKL